MGFLSLRQVSDQIHGHTLPSELWDRQWLQQTCRSPVRRLVALTEVTASDNLLNICIQGIPPESLFHKVTGWSQPK